MPPLTTNANRPLITSIQRTKPTALNSTQWRCGYTSTYWYVNKSSNAGPVGGTWVTDRRGRNPPIRCRIKSAGDSGGGVVTQQIVGRNDPHRLQFQIEASGGGGGSGRVIHCKPGQRVASYAASEAYAGTNGTPRQAQYPCLITNIALFASLSTLNLTLH